MRTEAARQPKDNDVFFSIVANGMQAHENLSSSADRKIKIREENTKEFFEAT